MPLTSRKAGRSVTILTVIALLVWTAAVRLPFVGNIGEDEVFFALVAQRWLADLWPYASSFDVKPPGLFAMFALAQAGFGTSVATIKGLEVGCVAVLALGIYLIGTRHLSRPVGWFAAALYPVYSLAMSGVNAPAELLKGPFEVFAVLAALEAVRGGSVRLRCVAAAGLLLGAAGTIKQTAGFTAIAVVVAILWHARGRRPSAAVIFSAGLICVPLGFVWLFWNTGHLSALLTGAVIGAAGRLSGDNISFGGGLLRFFPSMRSLMVLLINAVFIMTRGRQLFRGPLASNVGFIAAWLAGEAAGIVATRAMYDHYFLALVPPLALLAGTAICHVIFIRPARRLLSIFLMLALALVGPIVLDRREVLPSTDTAGASAAAKELAENGVPLNGHILVLGRGLLVYLYSARQPETPYFHPQQLLCDFPAPDSDPLAKALSERPDAIVIADNRRGMICERADRWAELQATIKARYCHAAHVIGDFDAFDIFVLNKTDTLKCLSD